MPKILKNQKIVFCFIHKICFFIFDFKSIPGPPGPILGAQGPGAQFCRRSPQAYFFILKTIGILFPHPYHKMKHVFICGLARQISHKKGRSVIKQAVTNHKPTQYPKIVENTKEKPRFVKNGIRTNGKSPKITKTQRKIQFSDWCRATQTRVHMLNLRFICRFCLCKLRCHLPAQR